MLNKRIASVLVVGMVMVSMTGCNARLTIGEKEIFNFSDKDVQQENVVENNKEVKDKEDNKTNKAEEKKGETKQQEEKKEEKYCEWCEKKTDHNSDDHIGVCYDCGKEMKAKYMEYNGRSFHCGCIDEETNEDLLICPNCGKNYPASEMCEDYCPECYEELFIDSDSEAEANSELWVCPDCGGSYTESDMIEDTENGIWYCYGCYDEIMNDRMGGDANGDLEEWEME